MSYEFADGYQIRNQSATHYLTFSIEGWVDLFSRKIYKDLIIESFAHCQKNKNLCIHAFVIMTNHVHTLWTAKNNNLSDVIRDFKTYTSKSFIKIINETPESRREWLLYMFSFYARQTVANKQYKIWTNDNHPEEIFSQDFFYQKLQYIHENPVRAGIVFEGIDYIYSSATNYANKKSVFNVDFLW
jgi:REP element-mobilizing transposase RayT